MNTKVKGDKIKEGSIPLSALEEMPYAYPVDTNDGKENKVVCLGGDCQYVYVGELVASEYGTPTEEKIVGEVSNTSYLYQCIRDGKYLDYYEFLPEYITLYIGNDVDGYTSNKVYISEDADNLTYYDFYFVGGFGPRSLKVAISPDYMLHYKNYWHYSNKNYKVFFASYKQQLDINLIPQEIARTEDVSKALDNYDYPLVTIDAASKTYSGQLDSKQIKIDINIAESHLNYNNILNYKNTNGDYIRYSNEYINIIFIKETNFVYEIRLLNPSLTTYEIQTYDYKNCQIISGNCKVIYNGNPYPATLDGNDIVTTLIHGKYLKYKLNRTTHLLELQSELDLNSVESRLAELEAKVSTL